MPADLQPGTPVDHIRAITLDLDDTLWAIGPVIRNAEATLWAWLAEHYPRIPETFGPEDLLAIREAVIEQYRDKSHDLRFLRKKVLARVAEETGYDEALVEPAFDVFDDARNTVDLYPDVCHELEWFYERYTVVAVTNGNACLDKIGIRHLFHGVVTAVDAGSAKPARPIFDAAIRASGVSAERILHVGDHPETDIHGARQAGLQTAWINRHGHEWPDSYDEPDAVVTTLTELRELLDGAR
jgi:HAD superfamily hydrolase (TIGR01549 family)